MIQRLVLIMVLAVSTGEASDTGGDLAGIKCVVSGRAASENYASRFKRGRVYFDCNASKLRFEADRVKFETKCNHQLVVTGQYIQARCPITAMEISTGSSARLSLAGVVLHFCCESCRNRLAQQGDSRQQIAFVFESRTFDRAFVPAQRKVTAERGRGQRR